MKIQYASDLHLEFPENKEFLKRNPLKPAGDILILAGDITPFSKMHEHSDFFDYLSFNFQLTYWLPGNHEYYHSDIGTRNGPLNEKIRDNVILVNNISVSNEHVMLIFSTLWTRISSINQFEIKLRLSDFHVISSKGKALTVHGYNLLHDQCVSFIKYELSKAGENRRIVVTHHMPTFMNYREEYTGDPLNEAFAVELSDLIMTEQPEYWIFGHHHSNKANFKIGKTNLLTNQLGYIFYHEQEGFDNAKIIEI